MICYIMIYCFFILYHIVYYILQILYTLYCVCNENMCALVYNRNMMFDIHCFIFRLYCDVLIYVHIYYHNVRCYLYVVYSHTGIHVFSCFGGTAGFQHSFLSLVISQRTASWNQVIWFMILMFHSAVFALSLVRPHKPNFPIARWLWFQTPRFQRTPHTNSGFKCRVHDHTDHTHPNLGWKSYHQWNTTWLQRPVTSGLSLLFSTNK